MLPSTSGMAASPGSPINCIKGVNMLISHPITGVNLSMVMMNVTGNMTFARSQVVFSPDCSPLSHVCLVSIRATPVVFVKCVFDVFY